VSWRRCRLDWLATEERGAVNPTEISADTVFHYSIPALDEIGDGRLESPDEIGSGKLLLSGGEVLISKLNPRLPRVLLAEAHDVPTLASTEFIALRPRPGVDERFLRYWLESEPLRQMLNGATMSVTRSQQRVRPEVVTKSWLTAPSLDEQHTIADYLDAETGQIDAVIAKRRRMIRLLAERCMSVMTTGVSGRLTNNAVVPSRLPWLETRGSQWREVKLSLIARLGSGHTPSRDHPEWWQDCSIPWITTGEVAQMRSDRIEFIHETREKVSELGVANSAAEVHPAGTVVLCRTASAGYSAIMGSDMATSQDFATWTCGALLRPRFLLLCLRVMRQDLLGRLAMGSTHKTIYMPDIQALRVPLPTVAEQDAIVDAVWSRLRRIHQLIDSLERQAGFLAERRQALITAAVTGEIDVPRLAA
jgi:type I restriction enzyme S subunit